MKNILDNLILSTIRQAQIDAKIWYSSIYRPVGYNLSFGNVLGFPAKSSVYAEQTKNNIVA